MTPIEITTLLHVYAFAVPIRQCPATDATVNKFLKLGLIQPDVGSGSGWKLTEPGRTMVDDLMKINPEKYLAIRSPWEKRQVVSLLENAIRRLSSPRWAPNPLSSGKANLVRALWVSGASLTTSGSLVIREINTRLSHTNLTFFLSSEVPGFKEAHTLALQTGRMSEGYLHLQDEILAFEIRWAKALIEELTQE